MVGVQYEAFAAGSSTPCAKLAAAPACERDGDQHDHQQEEGERARRERQQRADDEERTATTLQRAEREQRERDSEHEWIGGGENETCPDHGKSTHRPAALLPP